MTLRTSSYDSDAATMEFMHRPTWDFNIDYYINPFLMNAPLHLLPPSMTRFLGHRQHNPKPLGSLAVIFWAFIGIFCSISVIEVVGRHIPSFSNGGNPVIVGSFGAAAVLEFYAIESPLAQPRNAVLGQLVATICAISISKLFALNAQGHTLRWLGGALSCGAATSLMALTGTVHPPAGATALMAVVNEDVAALGWILIPVMLLGSTLMLVVALLINNIQRRFPSHWWTPEEVGQWWCRNNQDHGVTANDIERKAQRPVAEHGEAIIRHLHGSQLIISRRVVTVPDNVYLQPEERLFLEDLSLRL